MKQFIKKIVLTVLSVVMVLSMVACEAPGQSKSEGETVFTFAGEKVSLGELFIYSETVKQDYITTYGEDIWNLNVTDDDGNVLTLADATRKDIVLNVIKVKLLNKHADEYSVHLTADDEEEAENAADRFYNNLTDDQIEHMQLTQELVQKIFKENKLATYVREAIKAKAELEVSYEEARMTTFFDMYFPTVKIDEAGNIINYSDDEKQVQYEKALQAYSTIIDPVDTAETTSIEGLASYYNLDKSSYYTISPDEIRKVYGDEICDMMYTLEDGSCSLVTETADGYHIFYMKALTDEDETKKNMQSIAVLEDKEYFTGLYKKWMIEADPVFDYDKNVDFNVYKKIKFK